MSSTAATAGQIPGSVSTAAAAIPTASMAQVIAFGVIRVGITSRVRWIETRRT